jgi:hypothetical protein
MEGSLATKGQTRKRAIWLEHLETFMNIGVCVGCILVAQNGLWTF